MSQHHGSEKNEESQPEHGSSGPQYPDSAAKQFLNLSALAVREKAITLFLLIAIVAAGIFAFLKLGRAEDPTFTIKVFTVAAVWPGATAQEMEDLVAEPLEKRMQELRDYDRVETFTRPGLALMMVSLKDTTRPEDVPEEFYQARKKLGDEAHKLPQGVFGPFINDEYSDVTFALYSVEAPDLPPRQVAREAETLRQRMLHVPGVKKVDIVGERPERIFVEFSYERLATLGVSARDVFDALVRENAVTPSGSIDTKAQQVYIRLDGAFDDLQKIRDTPVVSGGRTLKLSDMADVKRGYEDPATFLVRHNGQPALLLSIVMKEGWNGLDLGKALVAEQKKISADLPAGISFSKVTDQDRLIREWLALLNDPKPGELETRIRRYDGEYRWFLIRVLPEFDAEGNVVRWLGSDTDIEDRKRVETKLLEEERELRRITDAIPQTIVVLDPKGQPLYANQAMLDYTGLTMQEVIASDFRARTYHPEDLERVREERKAGLARGLPFEIEQRALRKDGQYRWLLLRYNPFHDEQGRLVRWYVTGTDIDDRKRAEDRTRNENVALREDIVRSSMFEEIVGSSEPLRHVLVQVSKVAPMDSTVLVLGETGTGKELIARAIHNRSKRSNRAFIRVNCAAIPSSLIASELFGHERGSFTGATQRRLGRFESADGGTIFLDEVGDLPPETQVALLRVLQEREFERVGGSHTVSVDVRVIAATNRDLTSAVAEGTFRQDLFYRLNVFPIELPALLERISDISLLVEYLIDRYAQKAGKRIRNIDKKTMELFHAYDWPGNIRELQNVVERAVILCEGETFFVDEAWLTRVAPKSAMTSVPLVANLAEHEKEMLEAALRESEGVVGGPTGAAVKLGIPRQTLESKIRKLGINRYRFKAS